MNRFLTSLTVPDRAVVGVPFTATAITRSTGTDPRVFLRQVIRAGDDSTVQTVTSRPSSTWDLTGLFWGENLSPFRFPDAPPKIPVSSGTFTSPVTLTCQQLGEFVLHFEADILFIETLETTYSPELAPPARVHGRVQLSPPLPPIL